LIVLLGIIAPANYQNLLLLYIWQIFVTRRIDTNTFLSLPWRASLC